MRSDYPATVSGSDWRAVRRAGNAAASGPIGHLATTARPGRTSAPAGSSRTAPARSSGCAGDWLPSWARDARTGSRLINARAESVHYKPSFRSAFRLHRCLLPVDGWFEWQPSGRGKQPYYLTLKDGSPLSLAALWERWDPGGAPLETFTIITTGACTRPERDSPSPAARSSNLDGSRKWLDPQDAAARAARAGAGNPMTAPSRGAPSVPG